MDGHWLGKRGKVITWELDLSQSTQRKIKKLCDLCGLCEITRKCLQLSKFLMAEIRTNPEKSLNETVCRGQKT